MNSKGNRVILILVVGLASFTSAMRELNQLRQFGMEANQFIAEWSERLMPAEIPAPVMTKVQTCESKQSEPSVELPWLDKEVPAVFEFQQPLSSSFKFKSRKPGSFRINPRDQEMLKTLNRSINLRIAS